MFGLAWVQDNGPLYKSPQMEAKRRISPFNKNGIRALGRRQIDGRDFGSPRCDFANWLVVMAKKPLGTTGEFFRRRDEWRKHPMLSNQLRHATPGLGIALVAFGIYVVGEQVYNRFYLPSSSSSSHGQHSASSTSATH